MAEYEELRTALRWLLLSQVAPMPRYMRGRLGNGQGKIKVPGRPDFSYVRPSRSTDDVIEVFNKEVSGGDGTPVLVGELPWQPGLTQIVSVDWETYIQVGWGQGYAGVALHGLTHEWRDGFVGTDAFNVFRRQIAPMRTYPVGSGSQSVYIAPYDYIWNGSLVSWCGLPGIDLSAATPATGTARFMLTYLDKENNVAGVVTGSLDVHSDAIELEKPDLPTGTWEPSAFVRIYGGQGSISERDLWDARQLWAGASSGRPTGPAGGDLTGTYPNPTVRAIQGEPVSSATPNEGDLFIYTGSMWSPKPEPWMRALTGATYRTVWDLSDTLQSAAIISGGTITDNGDGTVAVAAGTGLIKTSNSAVGENNFFDWAADPSVTMVTGTVNWLYVDYNVGTPQVATDTILANIDLRTEIVLGRVWREGTTSHCLNAGQQFANYMTVACFRDFEVWGFQRASGLVTSEIGTRSIDVTAGVMYCAHNRITTVHSTGTFSYWYRDGGGGWTEAANQMQINNANYDDGDGTLGTLTANRYGVHWLYMEHDGHVHIQYGQGDYTKAGANDAVVPTTLPFLQSFALLIAKITIQEGQATFDSITVPWDTVFAGSSPVDHGDLAGLADDDHPQYGLIASAESITGLWSFIEASASDDVQEVIILERETSGAVTADNLAGRITFRLTDDAGNQEDMGHLDWVWSDPADGMEDGYLDFKLLATGTMATVFQLRQGGPSIPLGKRITFGDGDTSIYESSDDILSIRVAGTDAVRFVNNAIYPEVTNSIDLGSVALKFKDIWIDGVGYFDGIDMGAENNRIDFDADNDTSLRASAANILTIECAGADQVHFSDGAFYPETDNDVDLGTSTLGFKDVYVIGEIYLDDDSDTGIHSPGDGEIAIDIEGADLIEFNVEGIEALTRLVKTVWTMPPLESGNVAGQYFTDNDDSYPAGWTEDDAAHITNTNTYYGFWYLRGRSATASWQYSKATGFDLENDAGADDWVSWQYGPIFWRDGQYTAELDYVLGVYGSTGGVMDINTYSRVRLHWCSSGTVWQARGETRAGATDSETATAYNDFSFPLNQPVWIRLMVRNNAGTKTTRNYIGMGYIPLTQTLMSNVSENTVWGDLYYMIQMDRAGGVEDAIFIGLVDSSVYA